MSQYQQSTIPETFVSEVHSVIRQIRSTFTASDLSRLESLLEFVTALENLAKAHDEGDPQDRTLANLRKVAEQGEIFKSEPPVDEFAQASVYDEAVDAIQYIDRNVATAVTNLKSRYDKDVSKAV